MQNSLANKYKKTEVTTASREKILLMLYEGAIRFLTQAIDAQEKNNVEEKNKFLGRTIDVLNELRSTLNFEVGGDFSKNLSELYAYQVSRLTQATFESKMEYILEVQAQLKDLLGAWEIAVENEKKAAVNK